MKFTIIAAIIIFSTHFSAVGGALDQTPGGRVLRTKPPKTRPDQGDSFAINGKFYHDLKLLSVDGDVVEFQSDEGKVTTLWSSLPHSYQSKNADQKEKIEERIKRAKVNADTPAMHLRILKVLPEGVLADPMTADIVSSGSTSGLGRVGGGGGVSGGTSIVYRPSGKTIFVSGVIGSVDGDELAIRAKRDGIYNMGSRTLEKWAFTESLKK